MAAFSSISITFKIEIKPILSSKTVAKMCVYAQKSVTSKIGQHYNYEILKIFTGKIIFDVTAGTDVAKLCYKHLSNSTLCP